MTTLAWELGCLPGADDRARLARAADEGLAVEVAWTGPPVADTLARAAAADVPVVTLQAFGMHERHPLHRDPAVRQAGREHLVEVLHAATDADVPHVLAVCGYGSDLVDDPAEVCRAFFADAKDLARDLGRTLVLEPLSPSRAGALTDPGEFQDLLAAVGAPDVVATAIDTGHLLDGGHDPVAVLSAWRHRVAELQLRGAGSTPPPDDAPLAAWLGACPGAPDVVCVEHRGDVEPDAFDALLARVRALL